MKQILSLIFPLLIITEIYSQSFTATVNNNNVGLNEQFEVSFTYAGEDINGLQNFTPPDFGNFLILSGPNQATSMQIINGAVSASRTFSYYLQPRETGNYVIGPASIMHDSKRYSTEPIKITVVKGQAGKPQNQNNAEIDTKEISENLFVLATADKQKLFKGEQVTVTYKLYTRLDIAAQMSISKLPKYEGFWTEELETSNNIAFTTEVYNGKQFRVGILKKAALFPNQTGELTVSPFELKVPVLIRKKAKRGNNLFDDFFDDPFFGRRETVEYIARSNTLKLNVTPLPENAPDGFSGAVGNFKIASEMDRYSTKTNEPVSLKLDITGTGNIQLLNVPDIKLPTGIEKYEPKTTEKINRSSQISGVKSVEYLLIPRIAGKREIPPVEFSYFDPQKRSYVTLSTPAYTINVEQGLIQAADNINAEDDKTLGQDIRFIKTSTELEKNEGFVLYSFGFWTAAGVPLLLAGLLIFYRKREERLSKDLNLLKFQRAQKIAAARLKTAKLLMDKGKMEEFYSEISHALFGYFEDKFRIPKSEFTLERAGEELQKRNVDSEVIDRFIKTAERCEFVRFAPVKNGMMTEIYQESSDIIVDIEKAAWRNKENV